MVNISDTIHVYEGWIVNTASRCVISKSLALRQLSPDQQTLLNEQSLQDYKALIDSGTILQELPYSRELFQNIDCESHTFHRLRDGKYKKASSREATRNRRLIESTKTVQCHRVPLGGRHYIYISEKSASASGGADMLKFDPGVSKQKTTSVLDRVVGVQQFTFTQQDFDILKLHTKEHAVDIIEVGQAILLRSHKTAQANAANYLGEDYHTGFSSLIKNYDPSTLRVYGARLAPLLYVMTQKSMLSVFAKDRFLKSSKLDSMIYGGDITKTIKMLGKAMQSTILTGKFTQFVMRLCRFAAFDFEKWESFDKQVCPLKEARKLRQDLDAVRCLILFTAFSYGVSADALDAAIKSEDTRTFYKGFRRLYTAVSGEEKTIASTYINIDPDDQNVMVKNKIVSFNLIAMMRRDIERDFNACVDELGKMVSFGTPATVFAGVLGNPMCHIDNENEFDSQQYSIFNAVPQGAVSGFQMEWKDDQYAEQPVMTHAVVEIVSKLTKLLMLWVWLSPGLPLRYPELSILSFSGKHRNIFIDVKDRTLFVKSMYNKNRKFDNRLLFLDQQVSTALFWFIFILRPFVITILGDDVDRMANNIISKQYDTSVVAECDEDDEEENDRRTLFVAAEGMQDEVTRSTETTTTGAIVMRMFLFVDVKNMALVNPNAFNKVLLSYPSDVLLRQNLTISSMRQGLAGLWKHFILPRLAEEDLRKQGVATAFGHSARTNREMYGVHGMEDLVVTEGQLDYYMMKKLCREFQKMTNSYIEVNMKKRTLDYSIRESDIGDAVDLIAAGSRYYNNPAFQFNSPDQMAFTTMVLTSARPMLTLQAATGFGKSLSFILPMMVLQKTRPGKYVHFVGVPYEALRLATENKLRKAGLVVENINVVGTVSGNSKVQGADVLVGCFDAFGSNALMTLLANWDEIFKGDKLKGYLVFDEVHTFLTEKTFRTSFRQVKGLYWEEFSKVVFISATIPRNDVSQIAVERGINREIYQEHHRYFNAVRAVPNDGIKQHIIHCTFAQACDHVESYTKNYVRKRGNAGKAVFFFSNKKTMEAMYQSVRHMPEVAMISAMSPEQEKHRIFDEFENERSSVRVVYGTKLISNGLDCPCVDFVCLVDCTVDCIDYLQMVGRIRNTGLMISLAVQKPRSRNPDPTKIDWHTCITKQVAKFYDVEDNTHRQCCGRNDEQESDTITAVQKAIRHSEDVVEEDPPPEETPPPQNKLEGLLHIEGSSFLQTELDVLLERAWGEGGIRTICMGLSYAQMAHTFLEVAASMCSQCFYNKDRCMCRSQIGKATGALVCQLMILHKIIDDGCYERELHSLNEIGGYEYVFRALQSKHRISSLYSECLAVRNKHGSIVLKQYMFVELPHMEFFRHFDRLINSQANVFHMVFGKKYVKAPELFTSLGSIIEASFADTDTVKEYAPMYDTGAFSTASSEMIVTVLSNEKNWTDDIYSKMILQSKAKQKYLALLLWCLFKEKTQLTKVFSRLSETGMPSLGLYPVFFHSMFQHKLDVGGKKYHHFLIVMAMWMRGVNYINDK